MGQIIAIHGASGGLGASCLAAAVAIRAAAIGTHTVVVDLDHSGGGVDVVFGLEQASGLRWPDLASTVAGTVDGAALAARLPGTDGVRVLAHERGDPRPLGPAPRAPERVPPATLRDVTTGLGADHDLVVLDVSRDPDAVDGIADLVDRWVVLAGWQPTGLAAACTAIGRLRSAGTDPWVILRGPADADDTGATLAQYAAVELLGRLGEDRRLAADLANGVPPGTRGRGPLVDAADLLLARLQVAPTPAHPPAPAAAVPGTRAAMRAERSPRRRGARPDGESTSTWRRSA